MITIDTLFERYNELFIANEPVKVNSIFRESGMCNRFNELEYGFFPLGSGILKENRIEGSEIQVCNVMVLGNDFGTVEYLDSIGEGKREKETNATIRNLIKKDRLGLDLETTFFTNLYMGVRISGTNTKRATKILADFQKLCITFLKHQLEVMNPKTVIRLGNEVVDSLKGYEDLFEGIDVIDIPHPSFSHINWKPGMIDCWKKRIEERIK